MIQRFPAWLYRVYLRGLRIGGAIHRAPAHGASIGAEPPPAAAARALADLDADATRLGEVYRGIGVLVGILGAVIIFLALMPTGFSVPAPWPVSAKATKVALMVIVALLLVYAWRAGLQRRWIQARVRAERARYEALRAAIATAASGNVTDDDIHRLCQEVLRLLAGGANDQIRYNEEKRNTYAGIEYFTKRLTNWGFVASFVFAVLSLAPDKALGVDRAWLLYFTVFLPALIGTMHGVNGFLRLHQLEAQHAALAAALRHLQGGLPADTASAASREVWLRSAQTLLNLLRQGDSAWINIAVRQEVGPP